MTEVSTPAPWRKQSVAVGGLWAVGFGASSDVLLVVSVNGRGVFDCRSGERVARDHGNDYSEDSETVAGIGPLAGTRVVVQGIGGGIETTWGLPTIADDGWAIAYARAKNSLNEVVFLRSPSKSGDPVWSKLEEVEEVRAIGFSPTGRTMVVAEPHTVHLWCR